jgi:hypothetical protein
LIRLSLLPAAPARPFQRSRLRPSRPFYGAFSLATGRSRGFGPHTGNCGRLASPYATLRLAFASAPTGFVLASLHACTRRPIMQKVRRHPFPRRGIGLRPLVGVRFQVLFTRLAAVLFIVRSPYSFTIGHRGVFSLGRWSGPIHAGFHEPRATLVRLSTPILARRLRGSHPLWPAFPGPFGWTTFGSRRPQPRSEDRFGLFRVRSPLLAESMLSFSSCGYLDVSVPRVRSRRPMRSGGGHLRKGGVSPFGHRRINARLPTPRRLSQAAASFVASRCQDIHRTPFRA